MITNLARHERPILVHGLLAALLVVVGLALGTPVVLDYADTGEVARFPTAFLAASIMILAAVVGLIGLVLEGIKKLRHETARLRYLALTPPSRD